MTESELLHQAAEALDNRDHELLAELHETAHSWLMNEHDKQCLLRCLESMTEAAERLEGLE